MKRLFCSRLIGLSWALAFLSGCTNLGALVGIDKNRIAGQDAPPPQSQSSQEPSTQKSNQQDPQIQERQNSASNSPIKTGLAGPLALAKNGDIYVLKSEGQTAISKVTSDGLVSQIEIKFPFAEPRGIATNNQGSLDIVDSAAGQVIRLDPETGVGTVIAKGLDGASAISEADDGTIYVATAPLGGGGRIYKLSSGDSTPLPLAGDGHYGFVDSTDGLQARFKNPTGLAFVGGELFIADQYNNRIRILDLNTGSVSTLAGMDSGYNDGIGVAAHFTYPQALASDKTGSLYVVETKDVTGKRGGALRKIDLNTRTVSTLKDFQPDLDISGIAVGTQGRLLVADAVQNGIWETPMPEALPPVTGDASASSSSGSGSSPSGYTPVTYDDGSHAGPSSGAQIGVVNSGWSGI